MLKQEERTRRQRERTARGAFMRELLFYREIILPGFLEAAKVKDEIAPWSSRVDLRNVVPATAEPVPFNGTS
jgi:hypothetical protein